MSSTSQLQTVGRYLLKRSLGQGGMGLVYLAEDPLLKRRVAIKVVKDIGGARQNALLRFQREAEISAQLNHPNIVTAYDVGVDPVHGPFLAMEYVEGRSLASHIKSKDLDLEASIRVLIQAMRALRAAHRNAIVHRDVKPENILLSEEGRAKLMDFGIARSMGHWGSRVEDILGEAGTLSGHEDALETLALRLTQSGDFLGSPAYSAPEILLGKEATPSSDRYAFAATAFELLTGRLPHPGTSLTAIVGHILKEPPIIPAEMDPKLAAVFLRALSADPEERHATLPDFLEEVIDALPAPVSLRSRLFGLLHQEEDGTHAGPMRRVRREESNPPSGPAVALTTASRRQPVKIDLAEDPSIAAEWGTGQSRIRTRRESHGRERVDWWGVLKLLAIGILVGIVLNQVFWWAYAHFKLQ